MIVSLGVAFSVLFLVSTKGIPEHFPAFRCLFPKDKEFTFVEYYSLCIDRKPQAFLRDVSGPVTIYCCRNEFTAPQPVCVIRGSEEFRSPPSAADLRSIGGHDTGIFRVTVYKDRGIVLFE